MAPVSGTNPFEDSDEEDTNVRITTAASNPFDDDGPIGDPNPAFADPIIEQPTDGLPVEASWQYLGDLPYRRIPIYSNVHWHGADAEEIEDFGLATYSPSLRLTSNSLFDDRDARELMTSTTITKIAGCPHGGPVAAITMPVLGGAAMKATNLRIMTNAGRHLASVEMPPKQLARLYSAADVMTIGFTDRAILVVVLRDSLCLTYDVKGGVVLPPFHILPKGEGKGTDLLQATVFEGGVAVLSPKMQSAIVEILDDHDDPAYANGAHLGARRIQPIANSVASRAAGEMFGGAQSQPPYYAVVTPLPTAIYANEKAFSFLCIAVLPRFHTASRHPEVFLSTSDKSVVVVNTVTTVITDVDCRQRIKAPIVAMSFAPNGRFLACFTQSSILTVISTSFETKVLDFDTSEGSKSAPQDMKWCGEDSVVLHWKKLGVLMVGPYGDWLRFPYENVENLHIIPEIDCCRVITDNAVDILQRVPPATAALLRIGSIEPSAMLLDTSDAFERGSPTSDETARAIVKTGMLLEAIETCTDAATREYDVAMQKRLLRAAAFGMHFSYKDANDGILMGGSIVSSEGDGTMPSEVVIKFTAAARKLRILNALRNPMVGFVLTASQFDHITPTGVVARLVAFRRPALAASIAKYLNLPKKVQLFARSAKASAYVVSNPNKTDTETAEEAIKIINQGGTEASSANSGGYAGVAVAAGQAGRPGVANLLLLLESSVADKVPALISTGSFADAMAVATSAKDAEFIFFTLMEFEKACMASASDVSKGQTSFLTTVISKFTAEGFNTLRRYLETMPDIKSNMNLLLRAQKSVDAGSVMAKRSLDQDLNAGERLKLLAEASRIFGLGKDTGFHKAVTDEQIDLLKDQDVLRAKYGTEEVAPPGSSLVQTIVAVIHYAAKSKRESHKLLGDVDKIGRKFRVPEKRLWHIKVKALAESGQWPQLRTLADSKAKPPIGFKPFAMAAIKGKQSDPEIMRYIERVSSGEVRYDLFCEAALWKKAAEEAYKLRDTRRIANVRSTCDSPEVQRMCDEFLVRLVNM